MSREVYNFATTVSSSPHGPTGEQTSNARAIYVGQDSGTGSVGLRLKDGTDVLFKNVPSGSIIPVAHRGIHGVTHATHATTAKDIISLY